MRMAGNRVENLPIPAAVATNLRLRERERNISSQL